VVQKQGTRVFLWRFNRIFGIWWLILVQGWLWSLCEGYVYTMKSKPRRIRNQLRVLLGFHLCILNYTITPWSFILYKCYPELNCSVKLL
jgi:hypothetical protein